MKSFEFVGKNIEKAIENGLKELNKNREDVDISVISEGGLFSKAKVKISFEDETKDLNTAVAVEEGAEQNCSNKIVENNCECEEYNEEDECGCNECECDDCDCDDCDCEECECDECDCQDVESTSNCNCQECNEEKAKQYLTSEEIIEKIQEIFSNIFAKLNIQARVMVFESDEAYEVKVSGDEKVSSLIGYRGEGLNAYQTILNAFLELRNKSKKILIDVENYRNRREESLKALAQRIAKKVVKTKNN